ncbi:hypothetical protein GGI25_001000 [Coemansia spiralis]|uniref:Uncharacterized protein n=2 Tax=Coemansia TaxID=4863 RepID=A0A9W8GD65_9FUNG|nr:hypothetical protein BX070DRAFT_250408 [Coemansia spiralis]KAJ1986803.1 hypothetical protein EDC05_006153 [Coemansia umbellata]KAJ2621641.1 hypothetical protein GGI26_003977 [Coemansia sp. RSA 1358]KAJ2680111.1 hypothetical protein GGI25_001000 [Coemansia spiralis]
MSTWIGLSVAAPLGIGLCASYSALRPGASGWHRRLRKPKYNASHSSLLPLFAAIYAIEGIATCLVSNEMVVGHSTRELVAAQAGHWGLGFYWLSLTFLVFWPALIASESWLEIAMADIAVAGVFQFLALVQFFRLTTIGGLLQLLCFFVTLALGVWNAALIQTSREVLPL